MKFYEEIIKPVLTLYGITWYQIKNILSKLKLTKHKPTNRV